MGLTKLTLVSPNSTITWYTTGMNTTLTPDEAKEVLVKDQQEKMAQCSKEITEILEKYGFTLQVTHGIQFVPKPA